MDKGNMKFVIQRVKHAKVTVDDKITGQINEGLLILVGVSDTDTKEIADKMLKKAMNLRIFKDAEDKINLSLADVNGSCLIVSQFTLYADCKKGNRPSFVKAGKPDFANAMYEYILKEAINYCDDIQHGIFGADMKVELYNDGPFTIVLDSDEIM